MSRVYLVSKTFDPIIGITSGLWAYYLYEQRLQRPQGHTLQDLLLRKWDLAREKKRLVLAKTGGEDEEGWKELEKEVAAVGK